jgi:hypothetical protein
MSCQDFERVVEELADGRLMDAAARDAGLRHAALCVECAARLMEARGIGAGLRVAARAETEEAPARVRATLLAAFAEQQRGGVAEQSREDAAPSNVVGLASRRAARRWFAVGAAAAAAVVLLSLTLNSLVRFSTQDSQTQPQEVSDSRPRPAQTPAEMKVEKAGIIVVDDKVARQSPPKKSPARMTKVARGLKRDARGEEEAAVAQASGSEYMPLTYLSDAASLESGTVVRVQLSRSALISLGVPVEIDRADETFKADVVLGDDGIARAIRLVQD